MLRRALPAIAALPMATALMITVALGGCSGEKKEEVPIWMKTPAACKSDDDCAKDFICESDHCKPGQRSPAELAERKAAKRAKDKERAEAKKKPKPDEGPLEVRICPGFKNTIESIGTITAIHHDTKKRHDLHLALVVPEGESESEFSFVSLPLGRYDVTANYGIKPRGRNPEVVALKCAEKADPCREDLVREMEVVLPEDVAAPALNKEGKPLKKPCDFTAE